MLKKLKAKVFMNLCNYHGKMGMYYFKKIDAYGPENNEELFKKVKKHFAKETKALEKLVQL